MNDQSVLEGGGSGNIEVEKRLIRKCDFRVVPILSLLFMFSFMDRINIGNARIQGLEKDLHMKGQNFNVALQIFFIPYLLFEIPSNILLRRVAPSTWLSGLMAGWGITTICMGTTQSYAGLIVCRIFLGIFEAGFLPGCLYLISMYYRRYELQRRFNLFFSSAILSGAASGLLAYAVANMAGMGGYDGWRWIFIIEGLATVLLAIVSKFVITDWPDTAKFLTLAERALAIRRINDDSGGVIMERSDRGSLCRIFLDWKIWTGSMMYFGVVNTGYATSFFIPTILSQLGWTAVRAQVLSIPIYMVAATVTVIVGFISDRIRYRFAFTILGVGIGTIGYALLLAQKHIAASVQYCALYLVTVGGYCTQPLTLIWVNNNLGGHYKKGIGAAIQIAVGNLGGIVASNIFITDQAPTFPIGYWVSIALLWETAAACTIFWIGLRIENKKRDRGCRDGRHDLPADELENLDDNHPNFRYVY